MRRVAGPTLLEVQDGGWCNCRPRPCAPLRVLTTSCCISTGSPTDCWERVMVMMDILIYSSISLSSVWLCTFLFQFWFSSSPISKNISVLYFMNGIRADQNPFLSSLHFLGILLPITEAKELQRAQQSRLLTAY